MRSKATSTRVSVSVEFTSLRKTADVTPDVELVGAGAVRDGVGRRAAGGRPGACRPGRRPSRRSRSGRSRPPRGRPGRGRHGAEGGARWLRSPRPRGGRAVGAAPRRRAAATVIEPAVQAARRAVVLEGSGEKGMAHGNSPSRSVAWRTAGVPWLCVPASQQVCLFVDISKLGRPSARMQCGDPSARRVHPVPCECFARIGRHSRPPIGWVRPRERMKSGARREWTLLRHSGALPGISSREPVTGPACTGGTGHPVGPPRRHGSRRATRRPTAGQRNLLPVRTAPVV